MVGWRRGSNKHRRSTEEEEGDEFWSEKGSKALGLLKVVELNEQWEERWFSEALPLDPPKIYRKKLSER